MIDELEKVSKELLERLSAEEARPDGSAGTTLVGGLVKVSSKLEGFLRELIVATAKLEGCTEEALIGSVSDKKPSLRRATAGQLASGIRDYFGPRRLGEVPDIARDIVADLRARPSKILSFVKARNQSAHENADPTEAHRAARELRGVIEAFRKRVGFTPV